MLATYRRSSALLMVVSTCVFLSAFGSWQQTGQRYAVKCVKRADLPPEDEEDLKMEVKLLLEVGFRAFLFLSSLTFFLVVVFSRFVELFSVQSIRSSRRACGVF